MTEHKLNTETSLERTAANALKDYVVGLLTVGELTKVDLAEKLDLLPAGVNSLLNQRWELGKAIRIMLLLNQKVNLSIKP